jgi:hypothetical protein
MRAKFGAGSSMGCRRGGGKSVNGRVWNLVEVAKGADL